MPKNTVRPTKKTIVPRATRTPARRVSPRAPTPPTPTLVSVVAELTHVLDSATPTGKERLDAVLRELAYDLEPHLHGIGVAGTDGLGIAFYKVGGEAAEMLSGQMALIMQLSRRATTRMESSSVEDVLLTTDKSYMLGLFLGEGAYFAVVSVSREVALGNVRVTVRHYAERMMQAIRQ